MLSVITYNIQKGKKLKDILQWLMNFETMPDIICFQEFPLDRLEKFISTLNKKQEFSYRSAVGFVRGKKQFGQVTLVKKGMLDISENTTISLGKNAIENRVVRNPIQRTALLTVISSGRKKFLLINAHLVCLSLNRSRIKQVEKILSAISTVKEYEKLPIVILGDFNYSTLTRQKQLLHIMQQHGFLNAYKNHTHRLFYLKHQIDYVFYKHCFIDSVTVSRLAFSDHFSIRFHLDFIPKTRKKIAIFDFDGTLANTIPSTEKIVTLFNRFANDLGFTQRVTARDVEKFREKSLRDIISSLHIRFYKLPFILRKVQKGLQSDLEKAKPIVGIKDVLVTLKKHGYTLGIISSGKEDIIKNFLKKNGLDAFDVMYTGTRLFGKDRVINNMVKKYHFNKDEIIYVGDEIRDIEATKKTGIHMIAVTWGFNNKKGLTTYTPNFVVETPQELVDILV